MRGRALVAARAFIAVLLAPAVCAQAAAQLDAVEAFDREAVQPARRAIMARDVAAARQMVPVVQRAFDDLLPVLKTAQATTVQRLARDYVTLGLHGEAARLLEASAAGLQARGAGTGASLALVYADLARAQRLGGRLTEAAQAITRAQALRAPSPSDPDTYPIQSELAELHRARGDLAAAENVLRAVVDVADRRADWVNVPYLIGIYGAYAGVLRARGDAKGAQTYEARSRAIERNVTAIEEQLQRFR